MSDAIEGFEPELLGAALGVPPGNGPIPEPPTVGNGAALIVGAAPVMVGSIIGDADDCGRTDIGDGVGGPPLPPFLLLSAPIAPPANPPTTAPIAVPIPGTTEPSIAPVAAPDAAPPTRPQVDHRYFPATAAHRTERTKSRDCAH